MDNKPTPRIVLGIMAAVAVWGVIHAIGAYRFNDNPFRAVVVLACFAGFLGFWAVMLRLRATRIAQKKGLSKTKLGNQE